MAQVIAIGGRRRRSSLDARPPGARSRRRRRSRSSLPAIIGTLATCLVLGLYVVFLGTPAEAVSDARFEMCGRPPHVTCVIDGDTLYLESEAIRLADIDTPETHQPQCRYEAELGARATRRLLALVNEGPFTMARWESRDEDGYGRKLRVLRRNGASLGAILVREGLARPWTGSRQPWCG